MSRGNDGILVLVTPKAVRWQDLPEAAKQKAELADRRGSVVMGIPMGIPVTAKAVRWQDLAEAAKQKAELEGRRECLITQTPDGQAAPEAEPAKPTIELVKAFLTSREGNVGSPMTITSYRQTLSPFAKHFPVPPTTPEPLDGYFARFRKRKSAQSAYSPINQFYQFISERYGLANPMKVVKRPRCRDKEPYSLTLAEGTAGLNSCQNDQEIALYHLWFGHGWRPEEPLAIDVGHIGDDLLLVKGKTREEYTPLLPETRAVLLRLSSGRKPDEPLFTSRLGKRLSDRQAYNIAKDILRRAGVLDGKSTDLQISTGTLRKTFATLALDDGADSRLVDRLLRHRKRDIGDRYMGISTNMLRRTLERHSPLRLANKQSKGELQTIFSCSKKQPPFGYLASGQGCQLRLVVSYPHS